MGRMTPVGRALSAVALPLGLLMPVVGCAPHATDRESEQGNAGVGLLNLPDHFRSSESLLAHGQVTVLLSMWHSAAARGDFDGYFSRMTPDAVFLGTDPGERWTRAEFESFAKPYFDGVEAWTYDAIERHVVVGPGDQPEVAWFDEVLWNEKYGRCRGSGVALRGSDGDWRITQYNLAFLVPNDRSKAVMDAIGTQPRPVE